MSKKTNGANAGVGATTYYTNYKTFAFSKDMTTLVVSYDLHIVSGKDEKVLSKSDTYIVDSSNLMLSILLENAINESNDTFNYAINGLSDKLCYTYAGMTEDARDMKAQKAELLYIPTKLEAGQWYNDRNKKIQSIMVAHTQTENA